jgi:hypothetical protein
MRWRNDCSTGAGTVDKLQDNTKFFWTRWHPHLPPAAFTTRSILQRKIIGRPHQKEVSSNMSYWAN